MKSRRWCYGDSCCRILATLSLGLTVVVAHAACPPSELDDVVISKGELILAYRLVANTDKAARRIPMAKHFSLDVQLCARSDVSIARLLKVDATMPEHRHGMNYRPQIKPHDDGRFRVEGMMFHMAGHWELAFEVQAGNQVTRLTHDVQID